MRKKNIDQKDEHFLTRWSDKKIQGKDDKPEEPGQDTEKSTQEPDVAAENDSGNSEPVVLTDEDMPAIEQLDEKSDYSGFMSPGVSDELRKLALRKLFRSEIFNQRDGLDDYDDDFRSFAALGDMITSDMKHQMELAEEKKKSNQQAAADDEPQLSEEDHTLAEEKKNIPDETVDNESDTNKAEIQTDADELADSQELPDQDELKT